MIGFKLSYGSYVDIFVATENITVGGTYLEGKLAKSTSLEIKAPSILGGLIKVQFGTITFFNDGSIGNYFDLTVTAYMINVVLDTVTEIGTYHLSQTQRNLDTITFKVWEDDNDIPTPEDKRFGSPMDNGLDNSPFFYARSLLGITTITTVEDNSVNCPSYSGFKESTVYTYLKEGSSCVDFIDSLLKSKCCVGIRTGTSIEVINLFSGFKNVHHITESVQELSITRNKYKNITLKSNFACFDDVDFSDKVYDTSTTHQMSTYGADIVIDAYAEYTKTRLHTINAYKVFLGFPQVTATLTADNIFAIGDLVVVDDVSFLTMDEPIPFTFIVTGMRYSTTLDKYTVFGVGTQFYEMPDGSGGTYWTFDNCPFWDGSGSTPTSILITPTDEQTYDNITRVTITWDHVDAVVLDILVMIQQLSPVLGVPQYINVCSKNVKSDGITMSCIVPLDLVPGRYVYTIDIPNIGINSADPEQVPPRHFIIT